MEKKYYFFTRFLKKWIFEKYFAKLIFAELLEKNSRKEKSFVSRNIFWKVFIETYFAKLFFKSFCQKLFGEIFFEKPLSKTISRNIF